MNWIDEAIEHLAKQPICGYAPAETPAVEPTALAALALLATGRHEQAAAGLDWLTKLQSLDGSLGINADTPKPCWPTGWAILAWSTALKKLPDPTSAWDMALGRAVDWILTHRGTKIPRNNDQFEATGHDTMLQGWPWVLGTHSWVEPTAINTLALQSVGQTSHPNYLEAIALLVDRQLPNGGWNYGNTIVFGHELRPHVQATGLALAALGNAKQTHAKTRRSIDWLQRTLSNTTTTSSLCYALMGLAGHGIRPPDADGWLSAAYRQTVQYNNSPYHMALLVLAAKTDNFVSE